MKLIAAVDKHWGIGKNGDLLFHIPEDMKFFRSMTEGNIVVMGRKTLESMPNGKPLKNRINIVLSRDAAYTAEGARVCRTDKDVFIIGGAQIYKQYLDKCDTAYITHIDADGDAEVFFPDISLMPEWRLTQKSEKKEHNGLQFCFATYEKN